MSQCARPITLASTMPRMTSTAPAAIGAIQPLPLLIGRLLFLRLPDQEIFGNQRQLRPKPAKDTDSLAQIAHKRLRTQIPADMY